MRQKYIKNISVLILFFVLTFMTAASAYGQWSYYYGKNKVVKSTYKWNQIETEHFKIHYYTTKQKLIKKLAGAAEHAYKRISDYLNVKVKRKIPLIFYSTHIDFELNNITGFLPQGVVAFAESTSYRLVIQGDEPFEDLSHTIAHELGHIFEYEVMGRQIRFSRAPLWFMEGFSDFIAGGWDQFSLLTVRDAVLYGRAPIYTKEGELVSQFGNNRSPYDFGHLVWEFLDERYGKRGVKKFLYSARGGSLFGGRRDMLQVFDLTPKIFNHEFGKWLRERFKKFIDKEEPEDYSYIIGPDTPYSYSFSHQISPSGELLAVLTANMKKRMLQLILISMKDGKVIKNLTPGLPTKYDSINLNFNPTAGLSFAWNKDSNQIAFFVRKEFDNHLVIMDVLNNKILKSIKLRTEQVPSSPVFHPKKSNLLFFTGMESTKSFIYSIDLNTKKITKHTDGLLVIRAMDIAKDGNRIVYSAQKNGFYKLFLGTMDKPELAKQLSFGDYNDITPAFSEDGQRIWYSSDELESYNINSIDLETKKMNRFSDVKTGNFFPLEIPGEKGWIVMSSYYKGQFSLFKKDVSKSLEERRLEFEMVDTVALNKKEDEMSAPDIDIQFRGKYKPMSKLYIESLPPLSVSLGTDGGFFGYSYLSLSDLLGDHTFSMLISSYYGYRSYHFTYLKQSSRLQLYAHLFADKQVYYTNYSLSNYLTLRSNYGGEVGLFYPFSRSYRAEATASLYKQNENADALSGVQLPFGQYYDGWAIPIRLSLVGETTRFGNYGPNRGHTFKLSYTKYISFGEKFLDAYAVDVDLRKYVSLGSNSLLAFRFYGFKSGGDNPLLFWSGGNNTFRSAGFRRLVGSNIALFNAEFRFPLVHVALTPIGLIGPVRGVMFFDVGGVWFNGQDFDIFRKDAAGKTEFRLKDALSSYGFGVEFFLFGYPMHVEWVWRTDWKQKAYQGVNFWIGFDF